MKVVLKRTPFYPKTFSDGTPDPWADLQVTWTLEIPDEEKKRNKKG